MTFPSPLKLPDASMPSFPTPQSAMSEAVTLSKGPGLMRRISRGAASKLARRRPSGNNANSRDHSSGPVIMRRRSDSRSEADVDRNMLGFDLDGENEEAVDDTGAPVGLGLIEDGAGSASLRRQPRRDTEGGIAPIVPAPLQRGATLIKVSKKKRKPLTFYVDVNSAKVFWSLTDPGKRFYIDDIKQIRVGADVRNYREECGMPAEVEGRWFTIVYADQDRAKGRPVKTMHLIAPGDYMFGLWTSTLEDVARYREGLIAGLVGSGQGEKFLKAHWQREMAKLSKDHPRRPEEETLTLEGVENLCRGLHINCSKKVLRDQFKKADTSKTGKLNYIDFKDFVRRLKERHDIWEIYQGLVSENADGLDLGEYLTFLRDTQAVDIDTNCEQLEMKFHQMIKKSKAGCSSSLETHENVQPRMNFEAFSTYLSSEPNNVLLPRRSDATFDRPLNEYYISSSHNTYLLGRQVAGSSSTEAYIRALQKGCRSVEIDCWDGPDGRPIVSHGRTLTSSVLFSDCISVIGKYAFASSPYPLFLSLEVHCNPEQQQVMVDTMRQILGNCLVDKPFMTNVFSLPSPEELKHRILIKVKAGDNSIEKASGTTSPVGRRDRSFSSPFSRPQILDNSVIPSGPLLSTPSSRSPSEHSSSFWAPGKGSMTATSISTATDESDAAPTAEVTRTKNMKKRKSKIIPSLGDLGVYTRGLKYNSFALPESKTYNHIFSLGERTFEALCRDTDTKMQLEKHNQRYMMRVYPSAFRLRSKNFDPLAVWKRGVQMVALNWQTYDLGMQMNDAMFAAGADRTGYVLKPKELRAPSSSASPSTSSDTRNRVEKKLVKFSVEMISAQQLPRARGMAVDESLNPYIEIELFSAEDRAKGLATGEGGLDASARNGRSGIGSPHRRRTMIVPDNGYNPIFNDRFKLSLETKYPSLVFVRWTVWDSADGRTYRDTSVPLAMFTAKLSSLEQGYRHLPLFDHNGEQFLFSTLFCKIKKEEPVSIQTPENLRLQKIGRFRQFGQSVFKRTMSVERKNSRETLRSPPNLD